MKSISFARAAVAFVNSNVDVARAHPFEHGAVVRIDHGSNGSPSHRANSLPSSNPTPFAWSDAGSFTRDAGLPAYSPTRSFAGRRQNLAGFERRLQLLRHTATNQDPQNSDRQPILCLHKVRLAAQFSRRAQRRVVVRSVHSGGASMRGTKLLCCRRVLRSRWLLPSSFPRFPRQTSLRRIRLRLR